MHKWVQEPAEVSAPVSDYAAEGPDNAEPLPTAAPDGAQALETSIGGPEAPGPSHPNEDMGRDEHQGPLVAADEPALGSIGRDSTSERIPATEAAAEGAHQGPLPAADQPNLIPTLVDDATEQPQPDLHFAESSLRHLTSNLEAAGSAQLSGSQRVPSSSGTFQLDARQSSLAEQPRGSGALQLDARQRSRADRPSPSVDGAAQGHAGSIPGRNSSTAGSHHFDDGAQGQPSPARRQTGPASELPAEQVGLRGADAVSDRTPADHELAPFLPSDNIQALGSAAGSDSERLPRADTADLLAAVSQATSIPEVGTSPSHERREHADRLSSVHSSRRWGSQAGTSHELGGERANRLPSVHSSQRWGSEAGHSSAREAGRGSETLHWSEEMTAQRSRRGSASSSQPRPADVTHRPPRQRSAQSLRGIDLALSRQTADGTRAGSKDHMLDRFGSVGGSEAAAADSPQCSSRVLSLDGIAPALTDAAPRQQASGARDNRPRSARVGGDVNTTDGLHPPRAGRAGLPPDLMHLTLDPGLRAAMDPDTIGSSWLPEEDAQRTSALEATGRVATPLQGAMMPRRPASAQPLWPGVQPLHLLCSVDSRACRAPEVVL